MSKQQATNDPYILGQRAKAEILRPGNPLREFNTWEMFGRSFGFFQFKKKHEWTEVQVEEFRKGFEGEARYA